MALTDEQRAMLQLLLEGGQGYDDIGSLLGIPPDQVRSRARDALREMGGADPDAQVQLSDFLLGQADPIGRADAVRHLQNDPDANALASRLVTQLRLIAPKADLPEIPAPKGGRGSAPPPSGAPAGTPAQQASAAGRITGAVRGARSSKRGNQMIAIGVAVGALLLVAVLAIAGVFGGDDGDGSGDTETQTTASGGTGDLTIVRLSPLEGGTAASGQAVFAQAQDQPVLQINLTGLEPTSDENIYIVWLYNSDRAAFPLARDKVTDNGNLTGAAAIPNEIIPLLPQFGCIDVSLASTAATQQALQQAVDGQGLPRHTGETVLRGQIPTQTGGSAPSGADSQCAVAPQQQGGGGQ
jgi:hypothetical protein